MTILRPSHRRTHEGPLLVLAAALVCAACIPLHQWATAAKTAREETARESAAQGKEEGLPPPTIPERLLGFEKVACYGAFVWGGFILIGHFLEVRRQRRAFDLDLLPTEEGTRILPDDARPLLRKMDQLSRGKPFILTAMIRVALNRYGLARSGPEVTEAVRTQADVEMGRMVSSMATVHYLAWAIPALGFLGTVRGLSMSFQDRGNLNNAMNSLTYMFDSTLIALLVSLPLMFLLHAVQRDEEALVLDCQQYCLDHLVARLYDPDSVAVAHATD